jgi:hypothetical protein
VFLSRTDKADLKVHDRAGEFYNVRPVVVGETPKGHIFWNWGMRDRNI